MSPFNTFQSCGSSVRLNRARIRSYPDKSGASRLTFKRHIQNGCPFFPQRSSFLNTWSLCRRNAAAERARKGVLRTSRNNAPRKSTTLFSFSPIVERVCSSRERDRKSTRLNSSHLVISYAVFCLKKKKNILPDIIIRK